jgi:hypothetical protein
MEIPEDIFVITSDVCEFKQFGDLWRLDLRGLKFFRDAIATDFVEFIQGSEDFGGSISEPQRVEQSGEYLAVVDSESKVMDADFEHQFVDHQGRFYVGHHAGGAYGVEVALNEFSKPTFLRALATPDRGNVVAFKRGSYFMKVFGGESGERDSEVEPHSDGPTSVVLEVVHLPIGLIGAFPGEDFEVLKGGGIDRGESESPVDSSGDFHQSLPLSHGGR